MNIHIRPYDPADFSRLCQIHDPARTQELSLAGLPDAFVPLSIAADREGLFDYQVYVAEYSGTVAGFVAFTPEELAWLYVDPHFARRGIGRQLVSFALEHLQPDAAIEVLAGNIPALNLYKSLGFSVLETASGVMPGNESFHVTAHILRRL